MRWALGISIHTGWAVSVVVSGTQLNPSILANRRFDIISTAERFCFHRAAELSLGDAERMLRRIRQEAVARAQVAFSDPVYQGVSACGLIAKAGAIGELP